MSEPTTDPDAGQGGSTEPNTGTGNAPDAGQANVTVEGLSAKVKEYEDKIKAQEGTISNLYKESKGRQAKNQEYQDQIDLAAKKALAEETDVEKVRVQLTKENSDNMSAFNSKIDVVTNKLRQETVVSKIAKAAAKYNAFDTDQVIKLLSDGVGLDDNLVPFVIDNDGQSKIGAGGKPVTIDFYVKEFLDTYPNLVKGSSSSGSGSRSTAGGNGGFTRTNIGNMSSDEYRKRKAEIHADMKAGRIAK